MTDTNKDILADHWMGKTNPFMTLDKAAQDLVPDILLGMNDAPNTFVQYRNIPFQTEGFPEIVYKITATVNIDPLVYQLPIEEVDKAIEAIYATLDERVLIWYKIATDFYQGYEDADIQDVLISSPDHSLPARFGNQNNIEIWGVVFDSSGRWVSMKITDKTNPVWQYELLRQTFRSYDFITKLCGGRDLNNGGALNPYTKIKQNSSSSRTKKNKPEKEKPAVIQEENIVNDKVEEKKPDYFWTFEEVNALQVNSAFVMPIAAMSRKGKWLNLYPFTKDGNSELLISEEAIYLALENDYFKSVIEPKIRSFGIDIEEIGQSKLLVQERGLNFYGTKKLSKSGTVYYSANNITSEE